MKVDLRASFADFIFPFLFDPETFLDRVAAFDGATGENSRGRSPIWESDRFPEDDLMPQVARYLNPPAGSVPTARLWKLNEAHAGVWGLRGRADWRLRVGRSEIPFRIGDNRPSHFALQLVLFQSGVGFLTVHTRPHTEEVADWLDFIHHFRFARGQRGACLRGERRLGLDPVTRAPLCGPFFPEPAGGLPGHADGCGTFGEFIYSLLASGCLPADGSRWWRDAFVPGQLLPFAGMYADDVGPEDVPILVYRFRHFFSAAQEAHPTSDDLRSDHPQLLPYAERQWFVFSLDGGGFVACDAPKDHAFFRQTLPDHLRTSYLLLFLLALHQRFALLRLSEDVAEHWFAGDDEASLSERERVFTRIRDALLAFTVRGRFAQVMQREHHHRCYRKWLDILQIGLLYQEVRDEVQHIHDFLMMQRAERLDRLHEAEKRELAEKARLEAERERAAQQRAARLEHLLTALAAIVGVPALGLAFLQATGGTDLITAAILTAVLCVVGVAAYGIARGVLASRSESPPTGGAPTSEQSAQDR